MNATQARDLGYRIAAPLGLVSDQSSGPICLYNRSVRHDLTRRDILCLSASAALTAGVKFDFTVDKGFRSIALQAANLEETADFYGSTLGLSGRRAGKVFQMQAGGTGFAFEGAKSPAIYHFAFNIPENKLEEAQDWLRKRGVKLVERDGSPTFHFASWNAHATYFFDPAGNIVEFIARHTLPNASAGRFSEKSILSASELGVVVDDVPKAVDQIGRDLGMKPYKGQSDQFCAVGDEHALLIVVKRGRLWFGTNNLPATEHPAKAEIGGLRGALKIGDYAVSGG